MKLKVKESCATSLDYSTLDDAYQDYLASKITLEQYKIVKDLQDKKDKIKKRRSTAAPNPFRNCTISLLIFSNNPGS